MCLYRVRDHMPYVYILHEGALLALYKKRNRLDERQNIDYRSGTILLWQFKMKKRTARKILKLSVDGSRKTISRIILHKKESLQRSCRIAGLFGSKNKQNFCIKTCQSGLFYEMKRDQDELQEGSSNSRAFSIRCQGFFV